MKLLKAVIFALACGALLGAAFGQTPTNDYWGPAYGFNTTKNILWESGTYVDTDPDHRVRLTLPLQDYANEYTTGGTLVGVHVQSLDFDLWTTSAVSTTDHGGYRLHTYMAGMYDLEGDTAGGVLGRGHNHQPQSPTLTPGGFLGDPVSPGEVQYQTQQATGSGFCFEAREGEFLTMTVGEQAPAPSTATVDPIQNTVEYRIGVQVDVDYDPLPYTLACLGDNQTELRAVGDPARPTIQCQDTRGAYPPLNSSGRFALFFVGTHCQPSNWDGLCLTGQLARAPISSVTNGNTAVRLDEDWWLPGGMIFEGSTVYVQRVNRDSRVPGGIEWSQAIEVTVQ